MPSNILIDGNSQSEESIVDFASVVPVTLTSPTTTTYSWEFLDWPLDTAFHNTWLQATFPGAPAPTWTPDREGTWVVQLTDTNDGSVDIKVLAVRNIRTNIRVPGAGETVETADTTYNAALNHRGWALRRNVDLHRLDELATSGGIQLCYLNDVANIGGGTIDAGTLVSFSTTTANIIDPNTNEKVPVVVLADANAGSSGNPYAGAVKAGRVAQAVNPGGVNHEYVDTAIPNQTYIWVSRSGIVEAPLAGTLNFAAWTVGEYVYVSNTAGGVYREIDQFRDVNAPTTMTVAGVVVTAANPGAMAIIPSMSMLGVGTNQNLFKYSGIGEFSGLRLGRADAGSSAGEDDGTIEIIATNAEAGNITQGDVVSLVANGTGLDAWIADSSLVSTNTDLKRFGLIGVAVETVATGVLGHFTVYGSAPNATTSMGANVGLAVVGSSTSLLGDYSGKAVTPNLVQITSPLVPDNNIIVPVGTWDGSNLVVGWVPDSGMVKIATSDQRGQVDVTNVDELNFTNGNVYSNSVSGGLVNISYPNTARDHDNYYITIYEASVEGQSLWSDAHNGLAGEIKAANNDYPGAELIDETVNNDGLVGSFILDERYVPHEHLLTFKVYGYTDDAAAGAADVRFWMRLNSCGEESGSYQGLGDGSFNFGGSTSRTPFSMEFLFRNTSEFYGFLDPIAGVGPTTLDFKIIRDDVIASSLIVTRVVLQAMTPNKGLGRLADSTPTTLWENQIVGHAIADQLTGAHNNIDNTASIAADQTTAGVDLLDGNLSRPAGFVTADPRLDPTKDLKIRATVRYHDTAVATATGLRLWVESVERDLVYNESIAVAGVSQLVTKTPAGATTAAHYEVLCYEWTLAAASIPTATMGFNWLIEKTTADAGTAVILQLANIQFYQDASTDGAVSEVYENSIESVTAIDSNINPGTTLNISKQVDYLGWEFASGGSEKFISSIRFDPRYNERGPLTVKIIGWVSATIASPGVTLELDVASGYQFGSLSDPSLFSLVGEYSASSAAVAANSVRITYHSFQIPANLLWDTGGPNTFGQADDSHVMSYIRLQRTDVDAATYNLLSISVHADADTNIAGNEDRHLDINEDVFTSSDAHIIAGSSRHDEYRSILTSAHRYIWNFGADASRGAVAAGGGTLELHPTCVAGTSYTTTALGTLIPFNIVILGVYGWIEDATVGPAATLLGDQITLNVVVLPRDGGTSQNTAQGVVNFPLTISVQDDGAIRWSGNNSNFGADSTELPMVIIPENYGAAARSRWMLQLVFTNNDAANTIDLLANIQVEVALLPNRVL
tara:strand:+ start:260 stop:4144 length:3885 start_codon:yes stop_codon:yes gene_type:complete